MRSNRSNRATNCQRAFRRVSFIAASDRFKRTRAFSLQPQPPRATPNHPVSFAGHRRQGRPQTSSSRIKIAPGRPGLDPAVRPAAGGLTARLLFDTRPPSPYRRVGKPLVPCLRPITPRSARHTEFGLARPTANSAARNFIARPRDVKVPPERSPNVWRGVKETSGVRICVNSAA